MIISIWCSTTTYYMLAFLLDPHNSKQKSQRSCLRPGKLNTFSFHSHNLSPFTSNFKFRFPCKDCLCKQICLCPSVYFFSPKAMVYYQKICTQNFWYRWLYKLNMSIRCLALDVMCVLHVVLPSRHMRHHKASEEPRCLSHFFQTLVHKIPVR